MPERGLRLAQIALDAYYSGRGEQRNGGVGAADEDWSESDIVDLITDLLLFARDRKHDLTDLMKKVESHINVETGRPV